MSADKVLKYQLKLLPLLTQEIYFLALSAYYMSSVDLLFYNTIKENVVKV